MEASPARDDAAAAVNHASGRVEVPQQILQSGPVACPLILLSSLQTPLILADRLGQLGALASGCMGHSQGVASAAGIAQSRVSDAVKTIPAMLRQGLLEQQRVGLSHFRFDDRLRPCESGAAMLRGQPTASLQFRCSPVETTIVNSETTIVCSGSPESSVVERLRDAGVPRDGDLSVSPEALPIPFPVHSAALEPSLHQLLSELRSLGQCMGGGLQSVDLPLPALSGALRCNNGPATRLDELWRWVSALQLSMAMDYPCAVEAAIAAHSSSSSTTLLDFSPREASVASKLISQGLSRKKTVQIVPAIASECALVQQSVTDRGDTSQVSDFLQRIQLVVADILGVGKFEANTRLATAGFTSQGLITLRGRLVEAFPECDRRLPAPIALFEDGTLTFLQLAMRIADCASNVAASKSCAETSVTIGEAGSSLVEALPAIQHVSFYTAEGATYPLSLNQEQMMRLQIANPDTTAYNVSASMWIAGGIDQGVLQSALQTVLARHQVFSSTVVMSPPSLRLSGASPRVHIVQVQNEVSALGRMAEVGRIAFRLAEEPPIRAEIAVLPSGLVLMILWAHHINFDITSQKCLYKELYLILTGREKELTTPPVQYMDFAIWQRECMSQGLIDAAPVVQQLIPYAEHVLDLPLDGDETRPKKWTFRGDRIVSRLATDLVLPDGITPFIAHVTAFFIQLWKSTSQEVVILGIPYHGRDQPCLEQICGYFINMIPLIGKMSRSTTVAQALAQTKESWAKAMNYAAVPFLQVVDDLAKKHGLRFDPSRNPIFQAMINYRAETGKLVPDSRMRLQPTHQVEGHMDLDVQVDRDDDGIVVTHNYCTDLFHPRTAEKFAAQYLAALRAITRPEWQDVEVWKIPPVPRLIDDVSAAVKLSPEYTASKLMPLLGL